MLVGRELPEFDAVQNGTLKALHLPTRMYMEIGMDPRILPRRQDLEVGRVRCSGPAAALDRRRYRS